ncbi:hypothetical protein U9M48_009228, partial [Paspalum notatum var. saurae]
PHPEKDRCAVALLSGLHLIFGHQAGDASTQIHLPFTSQPYLLPSSLLFPHPFAAWHWRPFSSGLDGAPLAAFPSDPLKGQLDWIWVAMAPFLKVLVTWCSCQLVPIHEVDNLLFYKRCGNSKYGVDYVGEMNVVL